MWWVDVYEDRIQVERGARRSLWSVASLNLFDARWEKVDRIRLKLAQDRHGDDNHKGDGCQCSLNF